MTALDLKRIFEVEAGSLRRYLRRFGPSVPAEDVAQDSFVRLCAADPAEVRSPRAFLFQTARNLAIDSLRRRKAAPLRSVTEVEFARSSAVTPSAEDLRIAADDAAALREALSMLPDLQRRALLMRRVEKLPPAEIAIRLEVSERQVQRLVLKAIAACHAHLTESGDTEPPSR